MRPHHIAIALAALLSATQASAEAYKCRGADGRLEITNTPCATGSSTVKAVPDDKVSEERRRAAERDAARMREYVDRNEARQRADAEAEREAQKQQPAATAPNPPNKIDACLAELDRQALTASQRAQGEASCRGTSAVYVPLPVVVPHRYPAYPQPQPRPTPAPPAEKPPTIELRKR